MPFKGACGYTHRSITDKDCRWENMGQEREGNAYVWPLYGARWDSLSFSGAKILKNYRESF